MTYDNITHATDELLADILEEFNMFRGMKEHPYDKLSVMMDEAARRLRRPKNCPFNSEQFE